MSEVIAITSTELSAGFTLRMNGGLGRLFGSWPPAALMAACTSCAAASMLRSRANCSVMLVDPRLLFDVICVTPAICESCRSSGVATFDAIVSKACAGQAGVDPG